jgi:hypothetical protein
MLSIEGFPMIAKMLGLYELLSPIGYNAFYQKQCRRHPGTGIDACQAKRQLELPILLSMGLTPAVSSNQKNAQQERIV